ncbi:hypothetical protein McanMca71_007766 [Microsporum canis]
MLIPEADPFSYDDDILWRLSTKRFQTILSSLYFTSAYKIATKGVFSLYNWKYAWVRITQGLFVDGWVEVLSEIRLNGDTPVSDFKVIAPSLAHSRGYEFLVAIEAVLWSIRYKAC